MLENIEHIAYRLHLHLEGQKMFNNLCSIDNISGCDLGKSYST